MLIAETTLAVLLLTGAWVRLAAALGLAQSVAIALSVAFAPNAWPWSYWMMIGAQHGDPVQLRRPGAGRGRCLCRTADQPDARPGLGVALGAAHRRCPADPDVPGWRSRRLARVAAVLTAVAGLSLHAQLGFTDPLLEGTATSAVYFFTLTVAPATFRALLPKRSSTPANDPAHWRRLHRRRRRRRRMIASPPG